jgi:hypothetical protein
MSKIRNMQNGGKRARHSVDQWDRVSFCIRDAGIYCGDLSQLGTLANILAAKYLYLNQRRGSC